MLASFVFMTCNFFGNIVVNYDVIAKRHVFCNILCNESYVIELYHVIEFTYFIFMVKNFKYFV
jgi:hypothetical protein